MTIDALRPDHRLQPRRLDAGDGADLVLVGRIARNPDRAEHRAAGVLDQHATRDRNKPALTHARQHAEEQRVLACTLGELARAEAHAEAAPGLAVGDVETQDP